MNYPASAITPGSLYQFREPEPSEPARLRPLRLGAHLVHNGADFAVRAPQASAVELCLIDGPDDSLTERRFSLRSSLGVWSGHIPSVSAGQRYGYRVHGRWAPEIGLRQNPAKLLLDPYAKAITGTPSLDPTLYSHVTDDSYQPTDATKGIDNRDSAAHMCYGVVVAENGAFLSENGLTGTAFNPISHPFTPWNSTVIYEAHVTGLTKLDPLVPEELRGTYAGAGHPATINRLKSLGITALELLPIHAKMSEPFLEKKGLTNYWGYNTLNFFSPEPSYASAAARAAGPLAVVAEVKNMVNSLHEAGIEVLLDVVYNHTCEAGIDGPTVSWRGLDQTSYYIQEPTDRSRIMDTTGCGNSLDFRRQKVVKMALDSMRYWVSNIGIDGFRFDLAVTLGRNGEQFDNHHPFFMALTTDPVLSAVKIINEPWDLGPNGWQTGRFITPTADWNDHFRDTIRSFWISEPRSIQAGGTGGDLRDLATRLSGSADLFGHGRIPGGRGAFASINFVTAHDGFTMRDLVTYNQKHNQNNLENNRDGSNDNKSWNHGWEGNSAKADGTEIPDSVRTARRKAVRSLLGTLLLSAGTPMLTAGDELGRTQNGNNNSYCQDNETSWINWELEPWQEELRETTAYLIGLRQRNAVLRPTEFYSEGAVDEDSILDLQWLDASGNPMPEHKWFDVHNRTLQMFRSGMGRGSDAILVLNGAGNSVPITLPEGRSIPFTLAWDSRWERPKAHLDTFAPRAVTSVAPFSMQVYLTQPSRD